MRPSLPLALALASCVLARAAHGDDWEGGWEPPPPPPFAPMTTSIGDVKPASAVPAPHTASSRIAAIDNGALVSDADSGNLLRTNAAGAAIAQLAIGSDAGLLAYDALARRAYVADRRGDRVVVVDVKPDALAIAATWKTPAEPYGVALAPDRRTLFVTTIADRTLVAFDTALGSERWRTPIAAEPRGLAVAPDGSRVVIASLATGTLEVVALDKSNVPRHVALHVELEGQRARGAFSVAFVGAMAVAPYQLEVPVAKLAETSSHYGGSLTPPITHAIAWLGADGRQAAGTTNVHEPRALAWDAARDILYVAGLASDEIVPINRASQVDFAQGVPAKLRQRCGADGIAIAPDGDVLVWCSFTRSVARFDLSRRGTLAKVVRGPELVASSLDAANHEGLVLFHTANEHISGFGGMSCGNCHLDGRADGLSWKIGEHALQTPILAGRIKDTAPFKWDGGAKDLPHSLRATIGRLGGSGLSKKQLASLTSYVETMPAIRVPTRRPEAIARGQDLFESAELGCASCHDGPAYTDRETHELVGVRGAFDTPSLLGIAASAPYFHDGSAATLAEVLRDRGKIHGMSAGATKLGEGELRDLIAYLEAL